LILLSALFPDMLLYQKCNCICFYTIQEVGKFSEVNGLELEPEILPDINSRLSNSGWSLPLSVLHMVSCFIRWILQSSNNFLSFRSSSLLNISVYLHSNLQFFLYLSVTYGVRSHVLSDGFYNPPINFLFFLSFLLNI
jgi:hypothetical protein